MATKGFAFGNHSLLKKAGENFIFQRLGAARQRVGFRTKPIRELGAGSACSVFTLCVGALLWDADGVDHLVVLLLHLGFGSDAGQLHRLQRLIDAV